MRGAEASHGAEPEHHARYGGDVRDHPFPARHAGHVGAAGRLDGLDRAAAARALDQTDERQPQLVGHLLAQQMLLLDRRVGRATAHGEVVSADDDGATVDTGATEDEVRRREARQIIGAVIGRLARDLAELVERAGVHERVDALADGEAAAIVLSLHALRAAELLGERLASPQLVHLVRPAHAFR